LSLTIPRHFNGQAMRILVIEDDSEQSAYLCKGLREAGYVVDAAANGRDGLFLATGEPYGALLVDRMLPQMDGLSVIAALRAAGNHTPAIVVSALGGVDECVKGLRGGGDDYIVKPFAFAELLARLEAVVRRPRTSSVQQTLRTGDLEMDAPAHVVRRAGRVLDLKPLEFRLLEFLMRHAGQVVTRTMLLEGVWDYRFDPQTNVIDVQISRLRSKVDVAPLTPLIHTVRGVGYCLREPA
jgi:two-component system OmpR family response regulator